VKDYYEFAINRISKVQEDLFKWVDGEVWRNNNGRS